MGSARKIRKKYIPPRHPWNLERLELEQVVVGEYGLRNKKELWRSRTRLRRFRQRARSLLGLDANSPLRKTEERRLIDKLEKIGLLQAKDANLDKILSLKPEDFLERRLETRVFKRGLATTPYQARQLIIHGHIAIDGRRVNIPSYHVNGAVDELIGYSAGSALQSEDHPIRKDLQGRLSIKSKPAEAEEA